MTFDGSGSSDPDTGDSISYAWDLDGDGEFDDASTAQAAYAYPLAGTYNAGLRVTDSHGATATDFVGITAGDTPPTATIVSPTTGFTWKVGDPIDFAGSGTDAQDGDLPASALSWSVVLDHCPSGCHEHALQTFNGVDHGSFPAPDHEYPSYLELTAHRPRQRRPDRQPHDSPGPEDRGHLARLRPGRPRPRASTASGCPRRSPAR